MKKSRCTKHKAERAAERQRHKRLIQEFVEQVRISTDALQRQLLQRNAILERARQLLDPIDTAKLATKGFTAYATAISGARIALDVLSKQVRQKPRTAE